MRRYIKKHLKGIVKSLFDANKLLKKLAIKGNENKIDVLLQDMQAVAIEAGEAIERYQEDGVETVHLLEDICEMIWKISQLPINEKGRLFKVMQKELELIQEQIEEFPEKLEVAFLPYKVSMWDSLESVWKAADEDPDCDAYVIPIPYYDKNPDGTVRTMHYEIEHYPTYVPVVGFKEYNFEKRRPDVIFIHNPYDEYNYVTSVLPDFYSERLRCYTEKLVYIPYYVTGGAINETQSLLPSYFNMDHIIVQNERQIASFIPEISKNVSAFGSPKFDKVINLKVTDDMIPNEWKPKLRETVLFLNTGIEGILKNDESCLLKIQYIFKVVREEEVTLLWRPHPLLESTILSMRPELWQLYLETVEKFQELPNGILDSTENAELAIKISDAYLGEQTSSISHLFGVLGKPLFFIRTGILEEDKDVDNVKITCCVMDPVENNSVWAPTANRNGLMKISSVGKVEEFYIIPGEADKSNLYIDILAVERKLYLVPRNGKEIAIFDIDTRQFMKIALTEPQQKEKFNKGYFYEGQIYLIPRLYPEMVVLSCADGTLYYNKKIVDELRKLFSYKGALVTANSSRLKDESLYLAMPNKPYLVKYDLQSKSTEIHKISGTERGFCCMEIIGDKIVLGSKQGCEIVIWDSSRNTSEVIRQFPEGWNTQEEICFLDIVELQGDAYIFPRKNPMVLKLSMSEMTLTPLEKEFPFSLENRRGAFYNHPNHFLMVMKLPNGKVIVQDANRHGISEFSKDGTFAWKKVALTERDELKALGQSFARQGKNLPWGIYEAKHYSVRRMISYVRQNMHDSGKQKEAFSHAAMNLDGSAGQKIYAFIAETLRRDKI